MASQTRKALGLLAAALVSSCGSNPERFAEGTTETGVMLSRAYRALEPEAPFVCEPLVAAELERFRDDTSESTLEERHRLALSLLRIGRSEDAIDLLARVRKQVRALDEDDREEFAGIERDWAVACLRLAEQQNCIAHRNASSCVFPIIADAVHSEAPRGAEDAVAAWSRIVEENPEDLHARWLLNLSYMVLGREQDVPQQHLLPGMFASSSGAAAWPERGTELGVDVPGVSGGCVVDDFDGDGHLDILASAIYPLDGGTGQLRLFKNRGMAELGFEDVTASAGLKGICGGLNMVQADYDNDGDLDVFVLRGGWKQEAGRWPNTLLRNDGSGRFEDVTVDAGVLAFQPTQVATWCDFDGDGWIDLFVGNETGVPAKMESSISQFFADLFIGLDYEFGPLVPGHLYRNLGDGTFEDVLDDTGIDLYGWVKGASAADYDGDGRPDLYVSLWGKPNLLFRNLGGLEFEEVAEAAGVAHPEMSFSCWFWDYDNDGLQDIFCAGFPYPEIQFTDGPMEFDWSAAAEIEDFLGGHAERGDGRPRLYRNRGDGSFEDVTAAVALDKNMSIMGANFEDMDGDGRLDLLFGTGAPDFDYLVPNRAFLNRPEGFVDVSTAMRVSHLQKGHGVGFGDLDGDGDSDVYVVLGGAFHGDVFPNALHENPGHPNHRSITLRLVGSSANRAAIGARLAIDVELEDGSRDTIYRTVTSGGSFGSSSLQQEVGLGAASKIHAIRVDWPDRTGSSQVVTGLELDTVLEIRQPRAR